MKYMVATIASCCVLSSVMSADDVPRSAAKPAGLSIANIFADHMVLQRDKPVKIWGWGDKGEKVTVGFAGQSKSAVVADDRLWSVQLEPLAASFEGRDLTVTGEKKTLSVKDVLVGEVWHASGQSNMAMKVGEVAKQLEPVKDVIAAAKLPAIRLISINAPAEARPLDELPSRANWIVCSPTTAPGFSAVAFFFARRLHEELRVPVAIIDTSRGGTPIEPFIPRGAFGAHPTLRSELELGDKEDLAGLKKLPGGVFARDAQWLPGRLFHSRLAPIVRFAVRGLIWYQGESNCGHGEDPRDYQHKLRALIQGWRTELDDKNLPVYFVQLPGSGASEHWPYLREQQRLSMDVARTGMVVTLDLEGSGIHPANKVDVGERLAHWALANDFGKTIPFSGPLFTKVEMRDGQAIVHFTHADSGLMIAKKRGLDRPVETAKDPLRHFELADVNRVWWPAVATMSGATVTVRSEKAPKPTAVRYAYRVSPKGCNLYNRDGLPASPFCSHPDMLQFDAKLPQD